MQRNYLCPKCHRWQYKYSRRHKQWECHYCAYTSKKRVKSEKPKKTKSHRTLIDFRGYKVPEI